MGLCSPAFSSHPRISTIVVLVCSWHRSPVNFFDILESQCCEPIRHLGKVLAMRVERRKPVACRMECLVVVVFFDRGVTKAVERVGEAISIGHCC